MELKLTKESICINEVIYDGTVEQPVELDYLLPDYCPGIFKVLKCRIIPKITEERITGGKLILDGIAYIKIIYAAEETFQIRSITQKQAFSKSIDLKDGCDNGIINANAHCDYANCRVVNQRRLDIRGSVTLCAVVSMARKMDILTHVEGPGIQIQNRQITALDRRLSAAKEFIIKEELEVSHGKPAVSEILDYSAAAALTEEKIIANKVIVKGEVALHILYAPQSSEAGPEIMDYAIPVSQIVDLPGVGEEYQCAVAFEVTGADFTPRRDGEGDGTRFDVDLMIRVHCEANKNEEARLIGDIYSTGYDLQTAVEKVKIEQLAGVLNEICTCQATLPVPQGELSCVYDIWCDISNESTRVEDGQICVCGNLNTSILALDTENMPVVIEKTTPCEMRIAAPHHIENAVFSPYVTICAVSYSLLSGNEIEVRADVRICGSLYQCSWYHIVNRVTMEEEHRKGRGDDAVLRLYFAAAGERIWDIAKRFNTSVEAVMSENDLEGDILSGACMLLIPIVQ